MSKATYSPHWKTLPLRFDIAIAGLALTLSIPIQAQVKEEVEVQSENASLAQAAQNPIGNMISLPFQNNMNFGVGPDDRVQNVLNIQPVIPFGLGDDWTLITRSILPVISQPAPGDDRTDGIGDLNITGFF